MGRNKRPAIDNLKSGDKKSMDIFLAHARRMFAEAGLSENQVTLKAVPSQGGIGKLVMQEFYVSASKNPLL